MKGSLVRLTRDVYGLSQAELADRLGLSQGQVAHIEAGRKQLDPLRAHILDSERLRRHFLRGAPKLAKARRAISDELAEGLPNG